MKAKNYVNLTVNPCKMCMPLGAVTAFYGIRGCMSIIHGSQGCSTYIRRHMAMHYNEPIDIASSSLTEQGTVYGGEKNLIAGLENLVKSYHPRVIAVSTTCLAETIGEDVPRILREVKNEPFCEGVTLISVPTPGYGGTQFEGWFAAVHAAADQIAEGPGAAGRTQKVNLITGFLSPAEHRELKKLAAAFGLEIILLPDVSENLDRVYNPAYERLPQNGTPVEEIRLMGASRFTVELGLFPGKYSVGELLRNKFGVPFKRLPLPVGLRGTDALLGLFSQLSGRPVPLALQKERGRYLDAMVDAHKHCGEGVAAVYGDPDIAYGVSRLCLECGVLPKLIAAGGKGDGLRELLSAEVSALAAARLERRTEIITETDFETIGRLVEELGVNLMVGNSDGRRIEEAAGVPLIRVGFPVHDHVGGQRQMSIGYEGSLRLMDEMANALLHHKETTFRSLSYAKYYHGSSTQDAPAGAASTTQEPAAAEKAESAGISAAEMKKKTEQHPCFSCSACGNARLHLPIAPACNLRCNYCSRKYDCANESRPGVTSEVLTPEQAVQRFLTVRERLGNLTVVGIAGPGDALANFDATRKTLSAIRATDPGITFCLSTNGLLLPRFAGELVKLGVSHVTVTMNAVDDETGARIYAGAEYDGRLYTGKEAAALLRENQMTGIRMLAAAGITVKVNIVLLRGINEGRIEQIVAAAKGCGASITNIMQLIPVKGTPFENMELVSNKEIGLTRKKCEALLPQMFHCHQCRADAVGTLSEDLSLEFRGTGRTKSQVREAAGTLRFAVASKSGILIDDHFGHVQEFSIYEYVGGGAGGDVRYSGTRAVSKYCSEEDCGGGADSRMDAILSAVKDCDAVLCMRIGTMPEKRLRDAGKEVFMLYDRIESGVREAAEKLLKNRRQAQEDERAV